MGDNRDNSQDSRFLDLVGYVPEENFIGPVSMIVTNTEGVPTGNRPE
jgi:signal peptidase I